MYLFILGIKAGFTPDDNMSVAAGLTTMTSGLTTGGSNLTLAYGAGTLGISRAVSLTGVLGIAMEAGEGRSGNTDSYPTAGVGIAVGLTPSVKLLSDHAFTEFGTLNSLGFRFHSEAVAFDIGFGFTSSDKYRSDRLPMFLSSLTILLYK